MPGGVGGVTGAILSPRPDFALVGGGCHARHTVLCAGTILAEPLLKESN